MAQYELLLTGIGGQGVQLGAQVVARAATREGREVMCFGIYGGMMRGGNTESTVVIADTPISAPPVVPKAWAAIAMHDQFWEPIEPKLRPGGLALVNDSTFTRPIGAPVAVVRLPAAEIAAGAGNPMGATMVMAGVLSAMTGLVSLDALIAGMAESIPSYRLQHTQANERALRAGFEAAPPERGTLRAWEPSGSDLR